ncbi:MAG TPA: hypothetical protein VHA57_08260 [Actinomycetota bacterium]|nr:hypothetical protein [Actinomycetota bacterium]
MKPFKKILVAAATAALTAGAAALLAVPANAQPAQILIGPKQYFAGQVNGNIGTSVLSALGCPTATPLPLSGAATTAQGHPMPDQTVSAEFFPVPPPVPVGSTFLGYTGRASKVKVTLVTNLAEPPLSYLTPIATLTTYNTPAPIPVTLNLPCNATYQMLFTPVNGGRKAMTSVVNLTLESPQITTIPTPVTTAAPIIDLHGSGFVPATNYAIEECSQTNWIVPQDPCVQTNTIMVTTDTTGSFTHVFDPVPCTAILPSTCYVGAPTPQGIDTITLAGADKIIVP